LAIDPGERRTGIAVSDPQAVLARPLTTHDRRRDGSLLEFLARLCQEHGVERVLVGLPLTQMSEEGASAQRARRVAAEIEKTLPVSVELVDERYSSAEAAKILAGRKAPKERKDAVAAAIILQTYLDGRAS
jgi:putative Holliday junction resolvase